MILPGTYANGFAPRDGQPLYPQLWRGCVGAWNPGLGPTGLTLLDMSGNGRHAAITNATPSTIWTTDAGKYCLDGDGTDDHVSTSFSPQFGSQPFAMSVWVNGENASRFGSIFTTRKTGFNPITENVWAITHGNFFTGAASQLLGFGVLQTISSYRSYVTTVNVFDSLWHHIGVNWTGSTAEIYVDGVALATTLTSAGSTPSANTSGNIGFLGANDGVTALADKVDDARLYSRLLRTNEFKLLASRRGIAYELAPRRRSSVQVVAFNRRRRLLVGAGS
jgi:hypothetical protein